MPARRRNDGTLSKVLIATLTLVMLAGCDFLKRRADDSRELPQKYDGVLKCSENCQLTEAIAISYSDRLMVYGDVIVSFNNCSNLTHNCVDGMLPFGYPKSLSLDDGQWSVGQLSFHFTETDYIPSGCSKAEGSRMFAIEVVVPPQKYPFARYQYFLSDRFGVVELQAFSCEIQTNDSDCNQQPPAIFRYCKEGNFLALNGD